MPGQEHRENTEWLSNLRPPWKPRESGNPTGRAKGRSLASLLRETLDADEIGGHKLPPGKTVAHIFAEAMIGHAIRGNAACMREIFDRVDGKVGRPEAIDDLPPLSDDMRSALMEAYGKKPGDTSRA